jgi:hypothetical protein
VTSGDSAVFLGTFATADRLSADFLGMWNWRNVNGIIQINMTVSILCAPEIMAFLTQTLDIDLFL